VPASDGSERGSLRELVHARPLPYGWSPQLESPELRRLLRRLVLRVEPVDKRWAPIEAALRQQGKHLALPQWGNLKGYFSELEARYFPPPSFRRTLGDLWHDGNPWKRYPEGALQGANSRRGFKHLRYQLRAERISVVDYADRQFEAN